MNGNIRISKTRKDFGEPIGDVLVKSSSLKPINFPKGAISSTIDELPILFVIASLTKGISRFSNIYGPGQLNFTALIPDSIRSCILNKKFKIRSDGEDIRDFVYIDDIVDLYKLLLKNKIDVLFDDTEEHLSAKFKKFDLIGIPYQIILGSNSIEEKAEFKEINGKTQILSIEEIKNKLLNKRILN